MGYVVSRRARDLAIRVTQPTRQLTVVRARSSTQAEILETIVPTRAQAAAETAASAMVAVDVRHTSTAPSVAGRFVLEGMPEESPHAVAVPVLLPRHWTVASIAASRLSAVAIALTTDTVQAMHGVTEISVQTSIAMGSRALRTTSVPPASVWMVSAVRVVVGVAVRLV